MESPVQQIKLFVKSLAGVQLKFMSEMINAALDVSSGIYLESFNGRKIKEKKQEELQSQQNKKLTMFN